jgi:hypothetical protein
MVHGGEYIRDLQANLPFAFDGERIYLDPACTHHAQLLDVLSANEGDQLADSRVERMRVGPGTSHLGSAP